jgi:hypothetical protein
MGLKTKNNAAGTLASGITNSATSITLTATHGARFPTLGASDYFYATLADPSNNLEVVKVTARSGDVLTVVRGQDGTTGLAYSAGDRFELRPCNAMIEAIDQEALDPVIASGTDTYTGNLDPVPNGYNTDQVYFVKFPNANTSATPTLNLNSYGAKTIKKWGSFALVAGDIKAGMVGMLHYDGTDMILLNPAGGGKHAIAIPAYALTPRQTNGCAVLAVTSGAANQPDVPYLAFDGAAKEYASFLMRMPKGWNESTVTAAFSWRRASGVGAANVVWGIRAVAVSDNETPAVAFGSDATVTDAASTTTANMNVSSETGACTIGGTPAEEDLVFFEVFRDGAAAGDTLDAVDAWLTEVTLFITTNQPNDA